MLEYGGKGEECCKLKQICGVGIPKQEKERVRFLNCHLRHSGRFFLTNLGLVISNKKASEKVKWLWPQRVKLYKEENYPADLIHSV